MNESMSPREVCSPSINQYDLLKVNNLMLNSKSSPASNSEEAYCTPEGKNEEICGSARNNPKFTKYGVKAPHKRGFVSDSDSCSSTSARKPKRSAARNVLELSSAKVKAFRLDASDVDSSDNEIE